MAIASNMKLPYGDVLQNPEFGLLDFNADGRLELLVGDNWNYGPAGWVLYNYDGSNLIETAEMWDDDGTGEQVGYYPVQGDGMILTSAAANAIAAQYQPIANIIIQNQLELIGLVVRSWSTERRGISPPFFFFLEEICHLRACGDF